MLVFKSIGLPRNGVSICCVVISICCVIISICGVIISIVVLSVFVLLSVFVVLLSEFHTSDMLKLLKDFLVNILYCQNKNCKLYNKVRRFGDGLWFHLRFRQRDFTLLGRLIKDISYQDSIKIFSLYTKKFAENDVHVFKIFILTVANFCTRIQ